MSAAFLSFSRLGKDNYRVTNTSGEIINRLVIDGFGESVLNRRLLALDSLGPGESHTFKAFRSPVLQGIKQVAVTWQGKSGPAIHDLV